MLPAVINMATSCILLKLEKTSNYTKRSIKYCYSMMAGHTHDERKILPLQGQLKLHASQIRHKRTIYKHIIITEQDLNTKLTTIHTTIVIKHLANRQNNKILHTPPDTYLYKVEPTSPITLHHTVPSARICVLL